MVSPKKGFGSPAQIAFFLFLALSFRVPAAAQQSGGTADIPSPGPAAASGALPASPSIKPALPAPPLPLPPGSPLPGKSLENQIPENLKGKEEIRELLRGKKGAEEPPSPKTPEGPPVADAPAGREKSEIEAILSGKISSTVSTDLAQFGYDLFRRQVSTFAPVADVPVGPDYVIGPRDRFTIFLWGRIDLTFQMEVSKEGEIFIPKVGVLRVWGLTFSQLQEYLNREFSRYYKDFQLNLTMDRLRTIQVYVVGEAATPGSYTLSSLSTVYSALFAAGGPSKRGSLRNIQLRRPGKKTLTLDLYEFLLQGDKSKDERLHSGDTIFIPMIGPVAGVAGNVKRPGIYEMKGPLTLGELIETAGGVSPVGYLQRVQIERVKAHEKRVVADFNLSPREKNQPSGPELSVQMQDMDLVKVYPIFTQTQKVVYLEGHVKRPGGYEWREGMKLSDLVPSLNELLPEPYLKYARVLRLLPPEFRPHTVPVSLERLFLQRDARQDLPLHEHDRVTVFALKDMGETPQLAVSGEVNRPGKYALLENMRVRDLIYQAGNLKRSAYLEEAEVTRLEKTPQGVASRVININLKEAMKGNPAHNLLLQEDDHLFARQIPKWYVDKTISLAGEVKFPGVYTFHKGERLSSVLERAGGFTPGAYLPGANFSRDSVRQLQQKRIQEFVEQQEQEIMKESARSIEGSLSKDEADQRQRAMAQRRELLARLKTVSATGRIVIRLLPLETLKGSAYDVELEEGDSIHVPSLPSTVMVLGRVYNPNAILYVKEKTLEYYLSKVGGPAENADKKRMYLVKADGSVVSQTQTNFWGNRWDPDADKMVSGDFLETPVGPGDTVLVPERFEKTNWTKETRDWTQILFQIAVAAGVILALY